MVIDQGLTPVVWEPWQLDLLEEAGARRAACRPGRSRSTWRFDTGMSRQGVRCGGCSCAVGSLCWIGSCLRLEGVMTHFSAPETMSSVRAQSPVGGAGVGAAVDRGRGLRPEWLHAGNSSSIVAGPDREILLEMAARIGARLMLRPGLALYGYLDRLTLDGISWEGEVWVCSGAGLEDAGDVVAHSAGGRDRRVWPHLRRPSGRRGLLCCRWGMRMGITACFRTGGCVDARQKSADRRAGFDGPDGGGCYRDSRGCDWG